MTALPPRRLIQVRVLIFTESTLYLFKSHFNHFCQLTVFNFFIKKIIHYQLMKNAVIIDKKHYE